MSRRQLNYWLNACQSVSANRIDELTFAFGRTQTDNEGRQKMQMIIERMRNLSLVSLIKENM